MPSDLPSLREKVATAREALDKIDRTPAPPDEAAAALDRSLDFLVKPFEAALRSMAETVASKRPGEPFGRLLLNTNNPDLPLAAIVWLGRDAIRAEVLARADEVRAGLPMPMTREQLDKARRAAEEALYVAELAEAAEVVATGALPRRDADIGALLGLPFVVACGDAVRRHREG